MPKHVHDVDGVRFEHGTTADGSAALLLHFSYKKQDVHEHCYLLTSAPDIRRLAAQLQSAADHLEGRPLRH